MTEIKVAERASFGPFFRLYRESGENMPLSLGSVVRDAWGHIYPLSANLSEGRYWMLENNHRVLQVHRIDVTEEGAKKEKVFDFALSRSRTVFRELLVSNQVPVEVAASMDRYYIER